jgi:hypothetical protein
MGSAGHQFAIHHQKRAGETIAAALQTVILHDNPIKGVQLPAHVRRDVVETIVHH